MENSAVFEAKTKYTKESYIKFQRFNLFRGGATGKFMSVMVALYFIIGIACAILLLINKDATELFPAVFFILFGVFFLFMPQYVTYMTYRKSRALFDVGVEYRFFNDRFTVITEGSVIKGINEVAYEGLLKVCETKDSYYFYINRVQSFMLGKDSFTLGTSEGFTAMLTKTLPAKKLIRYTK